MPLLTSGSRLIRHRASGNGLLTNLVAYWGLDEAAGANNALDKHTNALTLTQVNSPGSSTGLVYAGARTFSSQYFARNSESLLQAGDIDFALAAWVHLADASITRTIIAKGNPAGYTTNEYNLRVSGGVVTFSVANGANGVDVSAASHGALALNTWVFVAAWHDATANKVYVQINNGTVDSANYTYGVAAGTNAFRVGADTSGGFRYWSGRLGPILFWKSRTLDTTARTALYNAGAGLTYAAFTA